MVSDTNRSSNRAYRVNGRRCETASQELPPYPYGLDSASDSCFDGAAMPFKSERQRRFLWAKHPDIAKRWAHEKSTEKSTEKSRKHAATTARRSRLGRKP